MTSAITPSKPQQSQQMTTPQQPPPPVNPASPPSKRDLKSWWKSFQTRARHQESQETQPKGIFGVPLRQSITYANVAISLVDEKGKSYIYGYVPIVVAKCGVFLKEKATGVEGIFRLSGSEKRIKELKIQFDSPDRYGKGLVWDGYTVHDAANVLRRYLNDLPEPVVPLDLYEKFRDPLRGHTKQAVGDIEGSQLVENFDEVEAIAKYQQLIKELPPLNRQLLLYILDLLAVFAAKAEENRMTAQNLAAIFQPGMLSHPQHAMAPEEYRLNQCVIIFLIENQDHFLIGMQGTGTDEKTKQEIEKGPPTVVTPATPSRNNTGITRSASNASAGAESVSRDGKIRRNRSTSSRHSVQSNGASTPGSPALTPNNGLGRSNTVPSKKSPHIPSGRFQSRQNSPTVAVAPGSPSPVGSTVAAPPTVAEEAPFAPERSPATSQHLTPMAAESQPAGRSQERLLGPTDVVTPVKERNLQNLFQRSPGSDGERRQPNKLRKKRLPSSTNPSAQSSTVSLSQSEAMSPPLESPSPINPAEQRHTHLEPISSENGASVDTPSEPTPRASQVPSANSVQADIENIDTTNTLKPKSSPSTSLHSSFNEGSDIDQVEENILAPSSESAEKEKKRRWRISRRREDLSGSPAQNLGVNSHAEMSTSSVGSGQRPRKSWTGESSDVAATLAESEAGSREKEEPRGPIGWIKTKYREAKENAESKRTKSPPRDQTIQSFLSGGKSVETMGSTEGKEAQPTSGLTQGPPRSVTPALEPKRVLTPAPAPAPHDVPLPSSPPPNQATHDERPLNT
ncbi:RhoGAP-domain-containing protein [Hypoxylon rubiginosum]|uniref:RhoGAP-domain-containing protein n=1 Tax=Hypoxylon rubiginosum TaxID=110542 RepID=A0ACB9Z471_9PEZI|nr:RhoGAP-domain-containing protein [Hypoxylon rubiginosum]